jgi:sugar lactone lactonase YvrE
VSQCAAFVAFTLWTQQPSENALMHHFVVRRLTFALSWLLIATAASPAAADLWAISTDASYSRVIRFDNSYNEQVGAGIPAGSAGLVAPSGITTGPDGTIYVSSRGSQTSTPKILAYKCGPTSCVPKDFGNANPGLFAEFAPADQAAPAGLRFGPDGNLYASELFGQNVRVYNPATRARLADAASGLPGTGGIAFEPNGDLLVGTVAVPDFMIPATISRFSGGGQQLPFYVASGPELNFASSLLFLPNGDLAAVDLFNGDVLRFTSAGQIAVAGQFEPIPTIIDGKPNFPSDIVYDPDGNLIVAVLGPNNPGDPGGNQGELVRFDTNGHFLGVLASQLEQVGGLAWTASPLTTAGNYDGAGGVTTADYAKWKADFGKLVAPGNGADGNGDGIVDAADYTIWRDHFAPAAGGGAASAVPEPATVALLVLGSVLAVGARMMGRMPLRRC